MNTRTIHIHDGDIENLNNFQKSIGQLDSTGRTHDSPLITMTTFEYDYTIVIQAENDDYYKKITEIIDLVYSQLPNGWQLRPKKKKQYNNDILVIGIADALNSDESDENILRSIRNIMTPIRHDKEEE